MPIVTIQWTGAEPATPQQKEALIHQATEMITSVLHKTPEQTWVILEEVPLEHWGVAGKDATHRFKKGG